MFSIDWSAPCKDMKKVLEETKKQLTTEINITSVDIEKNPDIAHHFNITSVPTTAIIDNGKIVWEKIGFIKPEEIIDALKS